MGHYIGVDAILSDCVLCLHHTFFFLLVSTIPSPTIPTRASAPPMEDGAGVIVAVAIPLTDPLEAVTVTVPGFTPVSVVDVPEIGLTDPVNESLLDHIIIVSLI